MIDYRYVALDRTGKQVTGTLSGRDENHAAAEVRKLGYYPVELKSTNGNGGGLARRVVGISGGLTRPVMEGNAPAADSTVVQPTGKKVGRVQILLFTRELSDLID